MGWLTTLFSPQQRALGLAVRRGDTRGFLRALDSAMSGKLGVMGGFLDGTAAYVLSFTWHQLLSIYIFNLHPRPWGGGGEQASSIAMLRFAAGLCVVAGLVQHAPRAPRVAPRPSRVALADQNATPPWPAGHLRRGEGAVRSHAHNRGRPLRRVTSGGMTSGREHSRSPPIRVKAPQSLWALGWRRRGFFITCREGNAFLSGRYRNFRFGNFCRLKFARAVAVLRGCAPNRRRTTLKTVGTHNSTAALRAHL